ncbi:hypothetical protein GT352_34655 [Streptomyces sp. SID1046]|uniref:DUF6348 family protein n=1 Tax=Streptomyces sp. SID1046 TaxID=2690249 RepID=UPI00136A36FA|nr:hypothetical protein [Streptomyces sp. SID1046]
MATGRPRSLWPPSGAAPPTAWETVARDAAGLWARSAGACLLELLYEHEELADHRGPDDEHGVPGWRSISSGALAYGLSDQENLRLQNALVEADVLREIADTFTADLESVWFNGVRVFYGGVPGAMEAEVRVNGEQHAGATAAAPWTRSAPASPTLSPT